MKKILFLVAHRPGRSPGQRFRFEQYIDYLVQNGYQCDLSYLISEKDDRIFYSKGNILLKAWILFKHFFIRWRDLKKVKNYSIVFIYREAWFLGNIFFEKKIKNMGAKIVLDFDDAIWVHDVSEGNKRWSFLKKPQKTAEIIKLSDLIIVGNSYLAEYSKQYNKNVAIIPTTLITNYYKKIDLIEEKSKICIGWTGSSTTIKHLELAKSFLKILNEKYPNKLYLKVIADRKFEFDGIDVINCKWKKDSEIEDLCEIDIGIMPLPDDDWAKGKCGFKGLQYMSLGIPAVMSPIGVNNEIIIHGKNGFLAHDIDDWVDKISLLIESKELRTQLGNHGIVTVEQNFSFNSQKEKYLSLFDNLILSK